MDESLYIVTALNGASVIDCFYDEFLIVVFGSNINFYSHSDGLSLETSIPLNAKVSCACHFDSKLFILTEKCELLTFKNRQVISTLDLKEASGRPADYGHKIISDPSNSVIICYMYQGICKVIPIESIEGDQDKSDSKKGKRKVTGRFVQSPFNVRLKELLIVDMIFLHNLDTQCLVILHQDNLENLHLVSYTIDFQSKTLVKSDLIPECMVDKGTVKLVPLMGNMPGKILTIGENGFTLISESTQKMVYKNNESRIISTWEWIDNKFLLFVDHKGSLEQLSVGKITDENWNVVVKGIVSQATSLCKVSENLLFVGSHYADSQLISIQKGQSELTVVDTITNLAPIIDFCLVDFDKRGQSQVVACCGAHKDGSLRIIRNGIGIEEIGELGDINGITGLFAIRKSFQSKFDAILAISFVAETRFQIMNDGVLEELENTHGLITNDTTLLCSNVRPDSIVQITPSCVFLINEQNFNCDSSWSPPNNSTIITASVNDSQILLGISGGTIVYLEIENGALSPISLKKLASEISCMNVSQIDGKKSRFCAIGTWTDSAVKILSLPSLDEVESRITPGNVIPRSIIISQLSSSLYLFVGLGDGTLIIYPFDSEKDNLNEPRKYTIGTQQIRLIPFCSNDTECVLACSDHPSVIHNENGKLRFANVNIKVSLCTLKIQDLNYIVPFNTEFTPHALAYVTNEILKVGLIEQIQRIHIKTIPIKETVRKIAHQPEAHVFGILTTAIISPNSETSSFKIMDEYTFELLDTYNMEDHEIVQSIFSFSMESDGLLHSYFVVGTAFVLPSEEEPNQGRIIIFEVNKFRKIILSYEMETKGCVYNLCQYEKSMLVASINSGVFLYKLEMKENEGICLEQLCSYHGYIVAVSLAICGTFIIVGDLMKSVSVLTYDSTENKLKESYRDYATNYMTCVEAVDEDIFLGSDNSCNVFTLKRSENTGSDNHQLEESGQYHLGEMINQFRHGIKIYIHKEGSLVLPINDTDRIIEPKIIFGTLNGSLGVIAKISTSFVNLLTKMEKTMEIHLKSIGGLSRNKWRTFLSERGHHILENRRFIDGDLIESYIDLEKSLKEAIYEDLKDDIDSVDSLVKLIEEISRSH